MRVAVAMSGGVDSAAAAAILVQEGADVFGITMHLSNVPEDGPPSRGSCCAPDDIRDARRAAAHLGIPHYVANYTRAFKEAVIDRFVADYAAGQTPSPCVHCNDVLKFRMLLERARAAGAGQLATGHYARVRRRAGRWELLRGRDAAKDQSYFLFGATQETLARIRFPVGELSKEEVRAVAESAGLTVAQKPESQDLCFVSGRTAEFLDQRVEATPGQIVDLEGRVLAAHGGVHRFTVGQRRGLGLPGGGPPRFVIRIGAADGRVVVGGPDDCLAAGLSADRCTWVAGEPPVAGAPVLARIRHGSAAVPAVADARGDRVAIRFAAPVRAVAPGQAVVLYDADEPDRVLGGGWIREAVTAASGL